VAGADFDALAAGYGAATAIHALRSGQLSRRLLLLRALLDAAASPALDDQYHLLVEAEKRSPDAVARTVAQPHFGAWIAQARRAVRGSWSADARARVLEHFGAVVAAGAIRAGLDFTLDLSSRSGVLFLPGLGQAATGREVSTVTGKGGEYRAGGLAIPADTTLDRPSWAGLRRISSTVDGQTLDLCLDDLDPYRDCHKLLAAERLTRPEADRWQETFDAAWQILVRHHPRYAEAIGAGLVSVVPLIPPSSGHGANATSMHSFGSVSLTPPVDGLALAVALLHEFQHAKLGALLDLLPLYEHDDERRYYAPWRDDPRPLGGVLQGVYAFLGVTDFWRVQRHLLDNDGKSLLAQFEFARWRERVWRTFRLLADSGRFTADGQRFLAGMRAIQESWLDDPVPDAAREMAVEAAQDHWLGWRLRNLRPAPERVGQLAEEWLAGAARPAGTVAVQTMVHDTRAMARNARLDLMMQRITQPAGPAWSAPEATPGDQAHVRGEYGAATQAYRHQLLDDPDAHSFWVGLALASQHTGEPGAQALLAGPELAYAVHRQIRETAGLSPDPLELADWLAGLVVAC
jgi:HEXXH motif-containing protein